MYLFGVHNENAMHSVCVCVCRVSRTLFKTNKIVSDCESVVWTKSCAHKEQFVYTISPLYGVLGSCIATTKWIKIKCVCVRWCMKSKAIKCFDFLKRIMRRRAIHITVYSFDRHLIDRLFFRHFFN